jgi:hypothetical protein
MCKVMCDVAFSPARGSCAFFWDLSLVPPRLAVPSAPCPHPVPTNSSGSTLHPFRARPLSTPPHPREPHTGPRTVAWPRLTAVAHVHTCRWGPFKLFACGPPPVCGVAGMPLSRPPTPLTPHTPWLLTFSLSYVAVVAGALSLPCRDY